MILDKYPSGVTRSQVVAGMLFFASYLYATSVALEGLLSGFDLASQGLGRMLLISIVATSLFLVGVSLCLLLFLRLRALKWSPWWLLLLVVPVVNALFVSYLFLLEDKNEQEQ